MLRFLPLTFLAAIAVAAPQPPENDATRMVRSYGVWSDPEGDAKREIDRDYGIEM